jgi:hypothetical protein
MPHLVPLESVRQRVPISRRALAEAIARGDIPVYQRPADRRFKLVDLRDVRRAADVRAIDVATAERPQRVAEGGSDGRTA